MQEHRADGKAPGRSALEKRIVFARHYIANGYNATQAAKHITSGTSYAGARVLGSRMLTDSNVQAEIIRQTAAILTPEQVKERISALSDSADTDSNKLRALELMGKVHALFIERNINENLNKNVSDESLDPSVVAMEALRMLRESEQSGAKLAQVIDAQQVTVEK